ncbi:MAG TPA: GNAT family N-acetyltransferase [Solirubrobacteraceae bacterium]|nr:GNAT family N-acetyltransferase [Solirubrobacteraceae bacterium]
MRELEREDWPAVLALNQASVRELSSLDQPRLGYILALVYRSLVVDLGPDGGVAAFAIAVAPGAPYDSANYRWFAERYTQFLYLDRIAVAAEHRRRGFGEALYERMEQAALPFARMVCDVNVRPRNDASLAFHAARGYEDVGRLDHGEEKTVALMEKGLLGS